MISIPKQKNLNSNELFYDFFSETNKTQLEHWYLDLYLFFSETTNKI